MTTRYAYIDITNNETLWGPGPNPYFLPLKDGTMWEVAGHSIAESEEKGVFIVEQVDKRDFDSRFEQQLTPTYKIKNGKPIEVYKYVFIPAARENMLNGVDEHAEKIRSSLATKYPGQYEEYIEVYNEALAVAALPLNSEIPSGTYIYLEADIGVTYSEALGRTVQSVREAADLVIQTRNVWKITAGEIRAQRLAAKKEIKEAANDAIAYELYKQFLTSFT